MTVSSSTTPTRSVTYDSRLIEDYLHVTEILVDSEKENPVAVIINGSGVSEALIIHTDGQLYHVCREPMSDSGWNAYGIGAGMTGIANASASTCWAVGSDSALWKSVGGRWTQAMQAMPGERAISGVSLGTDGIVYVVTGAPDFPIWWSENNGKSWNAMLSWLKPGTLPVGSGSNLWIMDLQRNIYSNASGQWQPVAGPGDEAFQLSVGFDGAVFLLGQNDLWQYANQQWQQRASPQNLASIAVSSADSLWAVVQTGPNTYGVQQYANGQWQTVSSPLSTGDLSRPPSVSVAADGSVCLVDSYGMVFRYLGDGGWQKQVLPTGMRGAAASFGTVDDVAAGADAQGAQHAFFVAGGTLYHARLQPNGGWSFDTIGACSGVGATNQLDTNELIAYGVSPDGGLVIVRDNGSGWTAAEFTTNPSLQGATIQLNAFDTNNWYTFALIGSSLYTGFGTSSNPVVAPGSPNPPGQLLPMNPYPNSPPMPQISRLARVPMFRQGTIYIAVVSSQGHLYMVSKIGVETTYFNAAFGIFEQLSGTATSPLAAVTSAAGVLDPDRKLRLYATDAQDKLWILRGTGSGNATDGQSWFSWSTWHPLGDGALYLANGPGNFATSEIYTLDSDAFLVYTSQNAATRRWSAQQVKKPAGANEAPDYVSQYVTQLTVLDQYGNAESDVPVTVTTEEPVSVWINGSQGYVDPDHPLTVVTGGAGTVTISTPALGLHTPKLTFDTDGLGNAQAVYPPQHVHDRLSTVDGNTLSNATAQTQGLPPVTQPLSSSPQADFAGAASAMNQVFRIPINSGSGPARCRVADPRTAAASLQFRSPSFTLGPPQAARAPGGIWDAFWQDLAAFGEDVYHGIRTSAMKVVAVGVDLERGVVSLGLLIEGIGTNVLDFWIGSLQDVADALHSFFAYIEAAVEQALDWLKELFEWQDILNTKTVIEFYLNKALSNMSADLTAVQGLVQTEFKDLCTKVSDAFTNAEATFSSNTFDGFTNGSGKAARGAPRAIANPLRPSEVTGAYQANKVRVDYVHSKSQTYFATGGTLNAAGGGTTLPADRFGDLLNLVDENILQDTNYASTLQSLQTRFQSINDAQNLFDMAICDFLELAQDFVTMVLAKLEKIVVAVLGLAQDALTSLQDLLNTPINIPSVSYIYQQVSGHPLTLLDAACLLMAMPATIIYKATWGGPNANPPFTTDPNESGIIQVSAVTGQANIPWPSFDGASLAVPKGQLQQTPALEVILAIEYCTMMIAVAANDTWTDLACAKAKKTPDPFVTFFSCLGVLLGIAAQAFSVPYEVIAKPDSSRSPADKLYLSVWGLGFLPILLNVLFIIFSNSKAMAIFTDKYGVPITTCAGAALLGVGIWAAVEEDPKSNPDSNYNQFYQAQAIVSPIPLVAKPLLMTKNNIALAVLLGLDVVCDIANGGLGYLEATS